MAHTFETPSQGVFLLLFFFFNDPPTPEISTLPLHDPLPILARRPEDLGDLLRILELRAEAPRRDCLRAALREERVRVLARVSLRDALRVFHRGMRRKTRKIGRAHV